jgi:hypothetical protein
MDITSVKAAGSASRFQNRAPGTDSKNRSAACGTAANGPLKTPKSEQRCEYLRPLPYDMLELFFALEYIGLALSEIDEMLLS